MLLRVIKRHVSYARNRRVEFLNKEKKPSPWMYVPYRLWGWGNGLDLHNSNDTNQSTISVHMATSSRKIIHFNDHKRVSGQNIKRCRFITSRKCSSYGQLYDSASYLVQTTKYFRTGLRGRNS